MPQPSEKRDRLAIEVEAADQDYRGAAVIFDWSVANRTMRRTAARQGLTSRDTEFWEGWFMLANLKRPDSVGQAPSVAGQSRSPLTLGRFTWSDGS